MSIDGQFTYFTFTDFVGTKNGLSSVVAADLNLSNDWYTNLITKYLNPDSYQKWFLGMQNSNLVALKSTQTVYKTPQQISYFVIDDTGDIERTQQLRKKFEDEVYPQIASDYPESTTFTDWDAKTQKTVIKNLVSAPVAEMLLDPGNPQNPFLN